MRTTTPSPRPSAPVPPVEQRSFPRKPFTASLDVRLPDGGSYMAIARDLSAGGIGAIVFAGTMDIAELQSGDSVLIGYEHPGAGRTATVNRTAQVRGRYGNVYGFRFAEPMEIG